MSDLKIKFNLKNNRMSLIKFNDRNRFFPWEHRGLNGFLSEDLFVTDDFFNKLGLMPAMNIKEHENEFELEFAAPGFSKNDFEIAIVGDVLHVYGEKSHEKEEKEEGYTCKEFEYNTFKRSLKLPNTIHKEKEFKATYKNGILRLNLLKHDALKKAPKKSIKIV